MNFEGFLYERTNPILKVFSLFIKPIEGIFGVELSAASHESMLEIRSLFRDRMLPNAKNIDFSVKALGKFCKHGSETWKAIYLDWLHVCQGPVLNKIYLEQKNISKVSEFWGSISSELYKVLNIDRISYKTELGKILSYLLFVVRICSIIFISNFKSLSLILRACLIPSAHRVSVTKKNLFLLMSDNEALDAPNKISIWQFLKKIKEDSSVKDFVVITKVYPDKIRKGTLGRSLLELEFSRTELMVSYIQSLAIIPSTLMQAIKWREEAVFLSRIAQVNVFRFIFEKSYPVRLLTTNSLIGSNSDLALATIVSKVKNEMLFYSTNSTLLSNRLLRNDAPFQTEPYALHADKFHLWNEKHRDWISQYQPEYLTNTNIVGPLMFAGNSGSLNSEDYLNEKRLIGGKKKIGVFDVTPPKIEWSVCNGYGQGYYTTSLMQKFLEDIFKAAKAAFGEDFQIILKSKRPPTSNHARPYLDFLDEFVSRSEVIAFKPNTNPWLVLNSVDMIVACPFTSMAEAGTEIGLPSVFYDPYNSIDEPRFAQPRLISDPIALAEWLKEMSLKSQFRADLSLVDNAYRKLSKALRD